MRASLIGHAAVTRIVRHRGDNACHTCAVPVVLIAVGITPWIGRVGVRSGIAVTGISLFVGGVGVMNIMFVSVTERTREIGIRKAIGAKRRAILQQFLLESSMICLVGGAIGVALSFAVAEAIDRFLLPASVSLPIVVIALTVSVAVGVISGFIPAWRASRLHPIDALHYE